MPVLYLLAPDEEAIASKACANKFFCSEISLAAEQEEKTSLYSLDFTDSRVLYLTVGSSVGYTAFNILIEVMIDPE